MQFPGLLTNSEYQIRFTHVPTGQQVSFPGWVTQFNDQYTSEWKATPTYGRMDPLATFQRTGRVISLSFDVVAASIVEARVNLQNISTLVKFLYPVYTGNSRDMQNTLSGGPLLGLKWTNLISSKGSSPQGQLYGYLGGLTYAPNIEDGGFLTDPGVATPSQTAALIARPVPPPVTSTGIQNLVDNLNRVEEEQRADQLQAAVMAAASNRSSAFIPKTVSLSLSFTVLHDHLMGWNEGEFGGQAETSLIFPYMPNQSVDPSAGVAPGSPGEELPPEMAAAQGEALE